MFKWIKTTLIITTFLLPGNYEILKWYSPSPDVAEMPLVYDNRPHVANLDNTPLAQRGIEFRKYLAASLKVYGNGGSSGSGTIIYYDKETGEAYIASCGHLWSGNKSRKELEKNPKTTKIVTWYYNNRKLRVPRVYRAQILFWSNVDGKDFSLLKFKPNWEPWYYSIAPKDYKIKEGKSYHSLGADNGKEVAHYLVEVLEINETDIVTKYNSPRPGRSGGGLLTNDWYYIATCWGTSDFEGNGFGYFTPLSSIHEVMKNNNFNWLLGIRRYGDARRIPVIDSNDLDRIFPYDYVPIPSHRRIPIARLDYKKDKAFDKHILNNDLVHCPKPYQDQFALSVGRLAAFHHL